MGLFDDHEVVIDKDAPALKIVIRRKPIFVRSLDGPWHTLRSPGGTQAHCSVSFHPEYHPDKLAIHPPTEGFIPPPDQRCTRNGCRGQFEVLDSLAAVIRAKVAEIEAYMPAPWRRTYEGRATGCPYCGTALPADDHPLSTYGEDPPMPVMVCPAVPEGKVMVGPVSTPPSSPRALCPKRKPFVNFDDANDVLWLGCDHPAGHGGKVHHDPTRDVGWYE